MIWVTVDLSHMVSLLICKMSTYSQTAERPLRVSENLIYYVHIEILNYYSSNYWLFYQYVISWMCIPYEISARGWFLKVNQGVLSQAHIEHLSGLVVYSVHPYSSACTTPAG